MSVSCGSFWWNIEQVCLLDQAAGREEEIIQCDLQADKDCSSLRTLTGKREIGTQECKH